MTRFLRFSPSNLSYFSFLFLVFFFLGSVVLSLPTLVEISVNAKMERREEALFQEALDLSSKDFHKRKEKRSPVGETAKETGISLNRASCISKQTENPFDGDQLSSTSVLFPFFSKSRVQATYVAQLFHRIRGKIRGRYTKL